MTENTGNTLLQMISFYYYRRALRDMRSLSRNCLRMPHDMHVLARKMAYTECAQALMHLGAGAACRRWLQLNGRLTACPHLLASDLEHTPLL